MCNLYSNMMPVEAMRSLFQVAPAHDDLGNAEPLPAIFPKGRAPVVLMDDDGARRLVNTHWGFVLPQTSKRTGKPIQPKAINNARDDKLRASPFWKASFETRRCLMPATSFCEPKGRGPATYHWFGLAGDAARPPFAFAAIWSRYDGPYGTERRRLLASALITTNPNPLVRDVHPDRMPAILKPRDYAAWLTAPADEAFELIAPYPADEMVVHRSGEDLKSDDTW